MIITKYLQKGSKITEDSRRKCGNRSKNRQTNGIMLEWEQYFARSKGAF